MGTFGRNQSNMMSKKITNYQTASKNHFVGARYIFECGIKLDAEPLTIATACVLYHRFFREANSDNYDIYLIGATCLYVGGKVESQHLKLRDVINVAYATIHKNAGPLGLNDKFWNFRDSVIQCELLIMRVLKFDITVEHPHKYLVHYLKTLQDWIGFEEWNKSPISRTSWAVLQDIHHDSCVLDYPPQALAVAAIQIAIAAYGERIPLCSDEITPNSWQSIVYPSVREAMQEKIIVKMTSLYEQEDQFCIEVPA